MIQIPLTVQVVALLLSEMISAPVLLKHEERLLIPLSEGSDDSKG